VREARTLAGMLGGGDGTCSLHCHNHHCTLEGETQVRGQVWTVEGGSCTEKYSPLEEGREADSHTAGCCSSDWRWEPGAPRL